MMMVAEMSVLDVVPGEGWPLLIDGERVGEIEDWETGQEICEVLNEAALDDAERFDDAHADLEAAQELYAVLKEVEYLEYACYFCGMTPDRGHKETCLLGTALDKYREYEEET